MPKNKERRRKLYERIAGICEVEQDVVSSVPVFTIRGKHEVQVEGCSGILEYDRGKIVLSLSGDKLTVVGEQLLLSDFRWRVLYIRGNIRGVYYGAANDGGAENC